MSRAVVYPTVSMQSVSSQVADTRHNSELSRINFSRQVFIRLDYGYVTQRNSF